MNWIKKGLIYKTEGLNGFDLSHCHKPTPIIIGDKIVRVFFGARDEKNRTRTTFIDLDIENLSNVVYIHDKPVLDLGKIGTFDDSGVNVSSIVKLNSCIYMYYIGVNTSTTVHMRNAIGLAVSTDNGLTFKRLYDGAIFDRSKEEPYYIGAVDVLRDGNIWKMYYTCGSEWKVLDGRPEIFYHIKYAESIDGINWNRPNITCIPPLHELEATARPCVFSTKEGFKMYYSRRSLANFRTNKQNSYRTGYAESIDGRHWVRIDSKYSIDVSPEGWDSEMVAYPYVIKIKDKWVMFYNGNGFGKSGFGFATLEP